MAAVKQSPIFSNDTSVLFNDTVYSFGMGEYGALGDGDVNPHQNAIPSPIRGSSIFGSQIDGKGVIQVSAGYSHSLILCDDGTVYSFGWNYYGQLGIGNRSNVAIPTPIDTSLMDGKRVIQVSAGDFHSLILCEDGTVYSFGQSRFGQLGIGDTDDVVTPIPTPIDISNIGSKRVIQVSAGFGHSLILCEDGSVFSFGEGKHGSLGDSIIDYHNVVIPSPIDTSNLVDILGREKRVIQVSAGSYHSLILCEDGTVYSFGQGKYGQLGLGIMANEATPTQIDQSMMMGVRVIQVSAGNLYSLILGEDGSVYSFGNGMHDQLGTGNTGDIATPTPINTSNMDEKRVIQVSAGNAHSLILCEDGTVYSFGLGKYGMLGDGKNKYHNVSIPSQVSAFLYGNKIVVQVAAGGSHSLLLT